MPDRPEGMTGEPGGRRPNRLPGAGSRLRAAWDRLRGVAKQLRALMDKHALERELDEEIEFHIARETEANVAAGMEPEEARRRALLEFRGRERFKEEVRDARWTRVVEDGLVDLRYGLRSLGRRPGFAAAAVLTLALGVGGTTAVFSVVKPVLFEPLPYPDPERIVTVSDVAPDGSPLAVTFGSYREVVMRGRALEVSAAIRPWQPTLTGAGEPVRLEGQRVGAGYFRVLGVAPALGRGFDPAEDRPGGADVAIIDHGLWRTRFGGDPELVGSLATLDGRPFRIVGVLPAGFENLTAESARIWAPLQYDAAATSFEGREWGHHLRMLGRLRSGVTPGQARDELDRIASDPVPAFPRPPWAALDRGFLVTSLKESAARAARPVLLAVLGAVSLLLLIACLNVTNLLIARGARRREEFAMRAALGAGRARLVRQLLTESLLLAGLGGAAGVALAAAGVQALVASSPPGLPRMAAIHMDAAVFAAAVAVVAAVGVGVGLVPALRVSRDDPGSAFQQRSRQSAGGQRLVRGGLVTAQVAISLVLLVGAGLLLRSLDRLFAVEPGFDATGVLTLQVQTSGDRFADPGAVHGYFSQVLEEVRAVPGVAAAALTSQLPLSGEADLYGVQVPAGPDGRDAAALSGDEAASEARGVFRYTVSPGYFGVMGVPVRRGRALDEGDVTGTAPVAVISESLARRRFPGQDALGRQVHVGRTDRPPYTVVGVVGDVSQVSLEAGPSEGVYVPRSHWYFADGAMWVVVRVSGNPGGAAAPAGPGEGVLRPAPYPLTGLGAGDATELASAVKEAIWSVDPDQPIVRVAALQDLVAASAAERRFALWIFEAFGLVALVLAAFGVYGVMAGAVAERRREIGVRSALGATPRHVVGLVVREGMSFAALGIAIGLAAAAASSRALVALLFGVSRLDLVTYASVVALLATMALIACAVPARRAARVDPSITLRVD